MLGLLWSAQIYFMLKNISIYKKLIININLKLQFTRLIIYIFIRNFFRSIKSNCFIRFEGNKFSIFYAAILYPCIGIVFVVFVFTFLHSFIHTYIHKKIKNKK